MRGADPPRAHGLPPLPRFLDRQTTPTSQRPAAMAIAISPMQPGPPPPP